MGGSRVLNDKDRMEREIQLGVRLLRESVARESDLVEEVNALQERVGGLLRQQREPHSLDEVIRNRGTQGG